MENYKTKLKSLETYVADYDTYQEMRTDVSAFGGEVAKFLRGLTGVSLNNFAVVLGVTPSYLSKVERGTKALSPEMARRLLELHGKRSKQDAEEKA